MQILVLGMHRTGTSMVARLLNMMGIYFAPEGVEMPAHPTNPKGFWERKDVNELCIQLLRSAKCEWYRVSNFTIDKIPNEALEEFREKARQIILRLDAHRPWFLKDPRLCLLAPLWLELLEAPVCLFVHRAPLEVARSLETRDGFPLSFGLALWERYNVAALNATRGRRRVQVNHADLMADPVRAVRQLQEKLQELGVRGLRAPSDQEIRAFIDPSLYRAKEKQTRGRLSQAQRKLRGAFQKGRVLLLKKAIHFSAESQEVLSHHDRWMEAQSSIAEVEKAIAQTQKELEQARASASALRDTLGKSEKERSALCDRLEKSEKEKSEARTSAAALRSKLEKSEKAKSELKAAIARGQRRTEKLRELLSKAGGLLERALTSSRWRIGSLVLFRSRRFAGESDPHWRKRLLGEFKAWVQQGGEYSATDAAKSKNLRPTDQNGLARYNPPSEYVPRYNGEPLGNAPVKVIAFYLPQFHPIPENDAFWGKGFTDWTNVQTAKPQFVGHYQPHLPGELGYYNLLDPAMLRRQVELAKLYGVGGFCFYFYWFGGKRPLEKPVKNYLEDTKLDLPFCLCWSNENWTRQWDGRENEVLIAQNHSAKDDLDFIKHISKYLRDSRYIRINGKPLLVVYRPNMLPSAKETAQHWRDWCRNNGVGELYLAYTQSFERVDPAIYGFDAAIEFPPNMGAKSFELTNLSMSVTPLREDFACRVLDWQPFVEESRKYIRPDYKLFRAVCPSWDNTPRRKNFSHVLLNSSPTGYHEWLLNAINDTCERFQNPDERLVFVNAWNEWGEGTHLEPDARYGYAYLEATRSALADSDFKRASQFTGPGAIFKLLNYHARIPDPMLKGEKICVQVHLFYTDLADHFAKLLSRLGQKHTLLISVQESEDASAWERIFSERVPSATKVMVRNVPNRGRDVLPWVVSFADEIKNHTLFCHLHSKKSEHAGAHRDWRSFLEHSMFGSRDLINQILTLFADNPALGLVYPPYFSTLAEQPAWGSNKNSFEAFFRRLSTDAVPEKCPDFPAGSFFWARTKALQPLFNLRLTMNHFPAEAGQKDGTLAHTIERILGILPDLTGMNKLCVAVDVAYHAADSETNRRVTRVSRLGRLMPECPVARRSDGRAADLLRHH